VDFSTLTSSFEGNLVTFTLSTPQVVISGASIALILKPVTGAILNGINNFGLLSTDDVGGTACSNFSLYKKSTDSGTTWGNSNNAGHRRGYFTLSTDVHSSSGSAYWIAQATSKVPWDMTTFSITEAPNGMGGTVTYDVGSGETATPNFTQVGLTKSQVQSLTGINATYLYVRVNLSSASPFYERTEVNGATITTTAR
jgi:hypothetical protein